MRGSRSRKPPPLESDIAIASITPAPLGDAPAIYVEPLTTPSLQVDEIPLPSIEMPPFSPEQQNKERYASRALEMWKCARGMRGGDRPRSHCRARHRLGARDAGSGSAEARTDRAARAAQQTPKPVADRRPPPVIPPGPNVRVELTITDQAGTDAPVKKTLSVIAADRHNGSVRSKVTVAVPGRKDRKLPATRICR